MGNGRCCWHSGPTHSDLAAREEKDPEGGPFPAYPSGKTWDEPSGKTGSGKKFFHNIIDGSKVGVLVFREPRNRPRLVTLSIN